MALEDPLLHSDKPASGQEC